MRVRKRPDLRLNIPSYPGDYVEMPPETKRLILEANRTPNDIPYIDDDPGSSSTGVVAMSPTLVKFQDDCRSPTPEIRLTDPEGNVEVNKNDLEFNKVKNEGSPVMYRRMQMHRGSSAPVLTQLELEALQIAYGEIVSQVSGIF